MNKLLITLGIALLFTSLACEVEMKSRVPPTQETKQTGVEATAEARVEATAEAEAEAKAIKLISDQVDKKGDPIKYLIAVRYIETLEN